MTGMFTWRYTVSGDVAAAHAAVRAVFEQHEFTIDERSADEWRVSHGSRPSFLAKMAGDYHEPVVLTVRFSPSPTPAGAAPTGAASGGTAPAAASTPAAATDVELHRPVFAAAGGVSRDVRVMEYLDHAYRETAATLREALHAQGILLTSSP